MNGTLLSTERFWQVGRKRKGGHNRLFSYLVLYYLILSFVSKHPDLFPGERDEEEEYHSLETFTFYLSEPLSKERVEAFSDGVYAIVATLLILDIW